MKKKVNHYNVQLKKLYLISSNTSKKFSEHQRNFKISESPYRVTGMDTSPELASRGGLYECNKKEPYLKVHD